MQRAGAADQQCATVTSPHTSMKRQEDQLTACGRRAYFTMADSKRSPKDIDNERTLQECSAQLTRSPGDIAALVRRGHAHLRKGQLSLALHDATTACQLGPTSIEAYLLCASICHKQSKLDEAIALYSKVLQLQPGHAKAALSRGACRNMKGDIAQALDDYALALAAEESPRPTLSQGHPRRSHGADSAAGTSTSRRSTSGSIDKPRSASECDGRQASTASHRPPQHLSGFTSATTAPSPEIISGQRDSHLQTGHRRAATPSPLATVTSQPIAERGRRASSTQQNCKGSKGRSMSVTRDTDPVSDRGSRPLLQAVEAIFNAGTPMSGLVISAAALAPPSTASSTATASSADATRVAPGQGLAGGAPLAVETAKGICSPRALQYEGRDSDATRPGWPQAADQRQASCSQQQEREPAREAQCRAQAAGQHLARAFALRRQGDLQGAVHEYSCALALEPDHFKALFNRGFVHDRLGNYAAAVADYTKAVALDPLSSVAFFNRGITRERMSDLEGALSDFTAAIELDSKSADAYHNRGYAYRKAGMLAEAVKDYTAALTLNPRHDRAYYNRGFAYEGLNMLDKALQDYSRSVQLEPGNMTAFHSRGSLLQRLGRPLEAMADFTTALTLEPACAFVFNARGALLQSLGQHAKALADFDCAVRLEPGSATFLRNRGLCKRAMGDVGGSITDFTQALQLDPKDVASHVQRAHSFRRTQQYEAAIMDYTSAIQLSGEQVNVSLYNHRAYSLAKIGCFAESVNDYNRVLELEPSNGHALYNRAFSLEKLGLCN